MSGVLGGAGGGDACGGGVRGLDAASSVAGGNAFTRAAGTTVGVGIMGPVLALDDAWPDGLPPLP